MTYKAEDIKKYIKMSGLRSNTDCFREKDFNDIINLINDVLPVDVSAMSEELEYFKGYELILRADEVKMNNSKEDVLQNAQTSKYGYFVVPKVIE